MTNLDNMQKPHPIGHKQKVGRYWRQKIASGKWQYAHIILAEQLLGRELAPNERVWFVNKTPRAYKDPRPEDIEIRITSPRSGRPPGRRKYMIRRIMELEFRLSELREQLGNLNEYYGLKRDNMTDPSVLRDWRLK